MRHDHRLQGEEGDRFLQVGVEVVEVEEHFGLAVGAGEVEQETPACLQVWGARQAVWEQRRRMRQSLLGTREGGCE